MAVRSKRREVYEVHKPDHFDLGLRTAACELLSLFLADKPVHKLIAKHYFEGIILNYTAHREERAMRLLIEIATTYRLTSWRLTEEGRKSDRETWVGMLFHENEEEGVRLSMHEACNKIIHADEIAFETRKVRKADFAYVRDNILVAGAKGKKNWTASIWIIEFCDAALSIPAPGVEIFLPEPNQPLQPTPPSRRG